MNMTYKERYNSGEKILGQQLVKNLNRELNKV